MRWPFFSPIDLPMHACHQKSNSVHLLFVIWDNFIYLEVNIRVLLSLRANIVFDITLHRKLETNIPRKETAWSSFQFLHSCICERFINSHDRSSYFSVLHLRTIVGIYKSLTNTIHECRNWEPGRAISFLGTFFSNFLYSAFAV